MKTPYIVSLLTIAILFASCTKETFVVTKQNLKIQGIESAVAPTAVTGYTLYTIKKGSNYSDKSTLKAVKTSDMRFFAKFDASSVYQNILPENQYDINKLWGFSEGLSNSTNSCRIGWSYNDGKYGGIYNVGTKLLRLSAYSYAKSIRYSKEICTVPISTDLNCSIKLSGNLYTCTVSYIENGIAKTFSTTINRGPTTTTASGYQQYPYFGGNETAPQNIYINIKPQ